MRKLLQDLKRDWAKPPNLITWVRIALCLVPGIVYLRIANGTSHDWAWAPVIWFGGVVLTDPLDGMVARWLKMVTDLGKLLDPFADKLLIIAVGVSVSYVHHEFILPTAVIVARELWVTGLRSYAKWRYDVAIAASRSGKSKMIAQSVMAAMMLVPITGAWWHAMTWGVIGVTVGMTVLSGIEYSAVAWRLVRSEA